MLRIVSLFVLVALYCAPSFSHSCYGTIINNTYINFTLSTSSIETGTLAKAPAVLLQPYSSTTFEVDSSFGLNDRISYEFGYAPIVNWCSGGNPLSELTGSFKYTYGVNSCDDSTVACPDGSNLSLVYQNCDGVWDTSNPTFNIFYSDSSK